MAPVPNEGALAYGYSPVDVPLPPQLAQTFGYPGQAAKTSDAIAEPRHTNRMRNVGNLR